MSLREQLPNWGHDIGNERRIFQSETGFCISWYQCWMPGVYQTFEAAEQAFSVDDTQLIVLRERPYLTTLYDIEQVLKE